MNNQLSRNEFKQYKKLLIKKYRTQMNKFIIEGHHLVEEALNAKLLDLIITSDPNIKTNFPNIKFCSYDDIVQLSTTKTPQNVIGICKLIKPSKIKDKVIVLNKINDPGNLGTLIRTAYAFGFSDVIVEGVDIYNPKVIRATQGAIFKINVFNTKNLETFLLENKEKGYQLIGSILDKTSIDYNFFVPKPKFMLILGNEAQGIETKIKNIIDDFVYIPIKFESLNVACAGAILMSKFK